MATEELPTDYDAIILGSGMTECIVAAALSRIGHNVLHMDRNDYYSGDWACFNWRSLQDWIQSKQNPDTSNIIPKDIEKEALLKSGEKCIELQVNSSSVTHVAQKFFVQPKPPEPDPIEETTKLNIENSSDLPKQIDDSAAEESRPSEGLGDTTAGGENNTSVSSIEEGAAISSAPTDVERANETHIQDCSKEEEEKQTQRTYYEEDITSQWRKFNLDLMPKVLFCRGPMVELLISSDVAKYCEFKTISRVLTFKNESLEPVPCSRADVFSSKQVSMIEKRMMMKFLQFSLNYTNQPEEYEEYKDTPFCEYLKSHKLTENVCHYIQHAIAMVNDTATTMQGLAACQRFIQSLGRYGNTAFLWPVYGSGEMPQCFCRMCAVFGGCYCLRRTGTHLVVDAQNKCAGIIDTAGQKLNCKWLVMESSYAPSHFKNNSQTRKISRAIYITSHSILQREDKEDLTQLSYPRGGNKSPVIVYEVGPATYTCPKGVFVVHFTCDSDPQEDARDDFEALKTKLFRPTDADNAVLEDEKPSILWQLYFEVENTNAMEFPDCPDGVFVVPGPDSNMDFENSIKRAKEIFTALCPEDEFLPKAPNPEDIIWNENDPAKETQESGFETEAASKEEISELKENNLLSDSKEDKVSTESSKDNISMSSQSDANVESKETDRNFESETALKRESDND